MYNCEKTIKKIAKAYKIVAYILMGLAPLVCILLAATEIFYLDELIIWVVVICGGALFLGGILLLASPFVWGFGDIGGNTKRIAEMNPSDSNSSASQSDIDELPEI